MRYLTIVCLVCGKTEIFRGGTTDDIIAEIDSSEWSEHYDPENWAELPKGQISGYCPRHNESSEEYDD